MAGVTVAVEEGDILDRPADVAAFKHADGLYGADLAAVRQLDPQSADVERRLPGPGGRLVVRGRPAVAAEHVLFVGLPSLPTLTYVHVREFARRAVTVVAAELPDAVELTMTLHGPGFGLDESEAFRAQVAGVLEAVEERRPRALRRVTFVELSRRRADRMRGLLEEFGVTEPDMVLEAAGRFWTGLPGDPGSAPWTAGSASQFRPHAFVAMPFHDAFEDRFHFGIAPRVHDAGLLCERMDQVSFTGDVVEMMKRRISSAEVVVADLSESNPNVYLEVGYAWACRIPTILMCDDATEPAFDVRGHRFLRYTSIRRLAELLAVELDGIRSRR